VKYFHKRSSNIDTCRIRELGKYSLHLKEIWNDIFRNFSSDCFKSRLHGWLVRTSPRVKVGFFIDSRIWFATSINLKILQRKLFETYGIDGYIIPSEDAHLSEYVAPEYARRYFISGLKVRNLKFSVKNMSSTYSRVVQARRLYWKMQQHWKQIRVIAILFHIKWIAIGKHFARDLLRKVFELIMALSMSKI